VIGTESPSWKSAQKLAVGLLGRHQQCELVQYFIEAGISERALEVENRCAMRKEDGCDGGATVAGQGWQMKAAPTPQGAGGR
jgi:hypothetical protein